MQTLVDQFIEGHARIKGTPLNANSADGETGESEDQSNVVYEDASSARGSFLVQQAMRAFQAQNLESAQARLGLCVEDSREEMLHSGSNAKNCSQLGALLGMLGDCWWASPPLVSCFLFLSAFCLKYFCVALSKCFLAQHALFWTQSWHR
jgi:hypothetical protein